MSKVTVTPNVLSPTEVRHTDIEVSFKRIKEGKSIEPVQEVRRLQEMMTSAISQQKKVKKIGRSLRNTRTRLKENFLHGLIRGCIQTGERTQTVSNLVD